MTLKIPIWDVVVEHDTVDNIGEVVALYNPTGGRCGGVCRCRPQLGTLW